MPKIEGIVIKGKQEGRILGFPTANLKLRQKMDSGVYSGTVILDNQTYAAAIFIPQEGSFIEAHILDFSKDIYGEKIDILIERKIREVMQFQNDIELKEQIKKDLELIRK